MYGLNFWIHLKGGKTQENALIEKNALLNEFKSLGHTCTIICHLSIDNPQSAMNWYEMDPIFRTWSWSRANAELRIVHSRLGCWSGRRQHGWQTSAQQHESHAGRSGWWASLLLAVATLKHLFAFYNRHNYWQVCRVDGRFDDWLRVCQKCFILPATILCTLLDCKT